MSSDKECFNGKCYYVVQGAWYIWGRWLLLALLIAFVIVMIPFAGFLMSKRRMRQGLPPVPGCAWMFPNPYKKAQPPSDIESQLGNERPPRYRPHNMYAQYQREQQQHERMTQQEGYSTDADIGDSTGAYSESTEKPSH